MPPKYSNFGLLLCHTSSFLMLHLDKIWVLNLSLTHLVSKTQLLFRCYLCPSLVLGLPNAISFWAKLYKGQIMQSKG